jgi:deoxyribodipyrimidine photolyase-related protein
MALFADGGILSSKPYAASGKYIERMSDYCRHCRYNVKDTSGPTACPFNVLYWNFLAENRDKLARNPRMAMIYKTLSRMPQGRVGAIRKQAHELMDAIGSARVTDGASSN